MIFYFFPNYVDVCEILESEDVNKGVLLDIKLSVEEKISSIYSNINFQHYTSVIKSRFNDYRGIDTERTIITSSNYSMNDEAMILEQGMVENNPLSTEACVAMKVIRILDSWYLEGERYKNGTISHSIEFSPQHYQAGLGILNYFGTVIRHRYPDIPVMVRIEQEGVTVRMITQTSEGHREMVEHTLQAYGLVVARKMLPEELLSDPYHVLELKHKLELTETELRLTHNLLQVAEGQNQYQQHRLLSLETEMAHLRQLIGDSLQGTRSAQQHAQELTGLLQPLLTNLTAQHDTAVQQALITLKGVIERGITTQDEQTVKEALATLQQKKPGVIRQMVDLLGRGAVTGAAGRLLYDWLIHLQVTFRPLGF
jgi:hypothetical protein